MTTDQPTIDPDRQAVRAFVTRHVGDAVTDDTDLFASGLASSLFAVQIVMWVERRSGRPVARTDLDMANFISIDAITAFLERGRAALPT